jgi:hypothetical protein
MKTGDSSAAAKTGDVAHTLPGSPDDRRSAVEVFESWQRQWPDLFRGAAWLHLERLKRALSEAHESTPQPGRHPAGH